MYRPTRHWWKIRWRENPEKDAEDTGSVGVTWHHGWSVDRKLDPDPKEYVEELKYIWKDLVRYLPSAQVLADLGVESDRHRRPPIPGALPLSRAVSLCVLRPG